MDKNYTFKFNSSTALEALKAGAIDPLDFYQARLDLFKLSIMADYDQLVCLPTLSAIDKYWYQIETARKVLRQLGGRALLADEVGLGKTIEAGLIIAEYMARSMVRSLLVLTPASLVRKKNKRIITLVWNPFTKLIEPLRCEQSNVPVYEFYLDDTNAKIIAPTLWNQKS